MDDDAPKERNVMDLHAAQEAQPRPGDGKQAGLGLLIALGAAIAVAAAGILAWSWLK